MDEIDSLIKQGRHDEAALQAVQSGQPARALAIYEKLWRFAEALPLALALGDRARAVRLALEAGQPERARQIAADAPDDDPAELTRIVDALAGRGRFDEAAAVAERAGLPARAADLYRRAGLPRDAARTLELAGRLREAADLLELVTNQTGLAPPGESAARELALSQLQLGRLLARLGRPLEAARTLQIAARHPETVLQAHKSLCGVLLTLGFPAAADEIARRLNAADPGLPPDARQIAGSLRDELADTQALPDRFAVERLIGGGATGRVYLAQDRLLGRAVALKALSVGATSAEEQALSHFLREAEVAARLRHPHIVTLIDLDVSAGLLVLEYLPGGSLMDVLGARGRLRPASVRRLALELLDALATAHAAGIVHRDVKPANIFFDAAGGAKLGDFGAAHLQDFGQTQTGGLIGTLAYLSPEQVTGARIGPQADLYGLAATLFEALTGRPPFLGPDFVSQHLGDVPPTPSKLLPGLDVRFDEVLLRALAKSPSERFAAATAMAEAVRAWPVDDAITQLGSAELAQSDDEVDPEPAPAPEARAQTHVGRTRDGTLYVRHEPRVDRQVVVEVRDEPLDDGGLRLLRARASAGGPHVQRVLGLSPDHREITYEMIEGEPEALATLSSEWQQLFTTTAARLGCEPARVVSTEAGPVLLIAPPLRAPDAR